MERIIQATQIDERCLSDIYRLPCVYGINKEYPTYNGTIKNKDFIEDGRAIAGYKILKYEQSKARNCNSEIFMEK